MLTKTRTTYNLSDRLVWAEGTQLTPQHFQYWERYLAWQREVMQWYGFNWGVKKLVIDERALMQGIFLIKHFELRFESGDFYVYDDHVPVTLQLDLTEQQHFPVEIVLCLKTTDALHGIPGYPEPAEYSAKTYFMQRADCYDKSKRRDLHMAEPDWHLCIKGYEPDHCRKLTLAKVNLTLSKQFEWAENYIPPLLLVQASKTLQQLGQNLLQLLFHSKRKLSQQSTFMSTKKHLLNLELTRYHSKLKNKLLYPCHPFDLFCLCCDLKNLVSTLHDTPCETVSYQHDDLFEVFHELYQTIDTLLKAQLMSSHQEVALKERQVGYWVAHVLDKDYWMQTLYLVLVPTQAFINASEIVLNQIKCAAPSVCEKLVASALSGMQAR